MSNARKSKKTQPSTARPSNAAPPLLGWLVYRAHPNGGAVFAEVSEAICLDAIHQALSDAQTWGEFRRLLPEGEWDVVEELLIEAYGALDGDDDPDPGRPEWELDDAKFDRAAIPGCPEGDYPRWLQQSLDDLLPREVIEQYAKRTSSLINGAYWFIDATWADEVAAVLRRYGYAVERAEFLQFF